MNRNKKRLCWLRAQCDCVHVQDCYREDLPMSENPFDDPGFQDWAEHVIDNLVPMIQSSAISVSLVPTGATDVKFAVELGFSIMLDKPIIAVVTPGAQVPPKLVAIADEIVEGDPSDPDFNERFHAAIDRQMTKRMEQQ